MNKKTKSFWMYTIILFTVALVIILLSVSMDDYKKATESSKNKIQMMQEENLQLKNENATLKKENEGLWVQVNAFNAEKTALLENENRYADAVENIYLASGCYNDGDYQKAKELIDKVDPTILKEQIREKYDYWKAQIDAMQ